MYMYIYTLILFFTKASQRLSHPYVLYFLTFWQYFYNLFLNFFEKYFDIYLLTSTMPESCIYTFVQLSSAPLFVHILYIV